MKTPPAGREESGQSMSAMTDVVFLLLIFFLVTMSGYVEMTLLEAGLPAAGDPVSAAELADVIQIDIQPYGAECAVKVNGSGFSREEFIALLKRYGRLQPDAELLISCDPESLHGDLVFVLSECARHGLNNLKMVRG